MVPAELSVNDICKKWSGVDKSTFNKILKIKEPLATVVMLSWRRRHVLLQTIKHMLKKQITPLNLCLTVQECTDNKEQDTIRKMTGGFNDTNIVFTKENKGTGEPRHYTLHRALDNYNTPYIHFTDDDMRLPKFAIELMIAFLEDNPEYACVNILTAPNSNTWIINGDGLLAHHKPKEIFSDSLALGSATLVIRREVFNMVDLDPNYKIGCADIDLGMQIHRTGMKQGQIRIPNYHAINVKGGDGTYISTRTNRKIIKRSIDRFQKKWGYRL